MENSQSVNALKVLLLSFLAISLYRYFKFIFFLSSKESDKIELTLKSDDSRMKNNYESKIQEIERRFYEEEIQDDILPYLCPNKSVDNLDDDEYEMVSDDEITKAIQFYLDDEFENNADETNDEEKSIVITNDENLKKSLASQKNIPNYVEPSSFIKTTNSESFPLFKSFELHNAYGIL
jgi:hypothetical protein